MKTAVYIDGFNLYYAALKGGKNKWLDIAAFCEAVLPSNSDIVKIKYFTAKVTDRAAGDNKAGKQGIYLKALRAHIPHIEIIHGHFSVHSKMAPMVTPGGDLDRKEIAGRGREISAWNKRAHRRMKQWVSDPGPGVHVINTEEKGSDVNLAVHMVNDAWAEKYECFAVISNDSDLAEAMRIVKDERRKTVALVGVKGRRPVAKLKQHATFVRTAHPHHFSKNQMPSPVPGTPYSKPDSW